MAHIGFTILLLFLPLVIGSNGTDPQCNIVNIEGNSSSAFNLTVSPETLSNNTNYTVTLEGSGNYTVILQALSASSPAGNWSDGNISCNGSPLFLNPFENGNHLQAQWTSPQNLTSVNITAYLHNENGTVIVYRTLNQAAVNQTTDGTTIEPHTSNSPASTMTSVTATTLLKTTKTTNAASAVQTSLVTVIQILGLLTITSKFLS